MNEIKNTFLVQLRGPFIAEDNLLTRLKEEASFDINDSNERRYIKKIGIQITPEYAFDIQAKAVAEMKNPNNNGSSNLSESHHKIVIGQSEKDYFFIGSTGILEINNLPYSDEKKITNFYFLQDENELTLIDLILTETQNNNTTPEEDNE